MLLQCSKQTKLLIAYLHDQNKSCFFGGPAFIQLQKALIGWKKAGLPKKPLLF